MRSNAEDGTGWDITYNEEGRKGVICLIQHSNKEDKTRSTKKNMYEPYFHLNVCMPH